MKKIVLFLLFAVSLQAQVILNEQFDDFTLNVSKYSPLAYWVFSDGYHTSKATGLTKWQDLSGNGYNLTTVGGIDTTSELYSSALYRGSYSPKFDGVDDYLYIPAANSTGLNPDVNSFTLLLRYSSTSTAGTLRGIDKSGGAAQYATRFLMSIKYYRVDYIDDSGNLFTYSAAVNYINDGNLNNFLMVMDRATSNATFYANGKLLYINSISPLSGGINPTGDFNIGVYHVGATFANFYDGVFYDAAYFNRALTAKEAREIHALAYAWHSKNGNVTRDLTVPEWFQTFHDTIGTVIPTATLASGKRYQLRFDAKSSDANKTIRVWAGSATAPKTEVKTVTASSGWSVHTLDFGYGYDLTGDTLWFATNSLVDTVSIDNVRLEAVSASSKKGFGGWLGW